MRIEELAFVCEEAARDLAQRHGRPVPPAIVLPSPQATRIITLPDFPDDDAARLAVLSHIAQQEILGRSQPAYGFISEAALEDGSEILVLVHGAHSNPPRISGAFLRDGEVGDFSAPEPLHPDAMTFLHPLQHAVEQVREPPPGPGIPGFGST